MSHGTQWNFSACLGWGHNRFWPRICFSPSKTRKMWHFVCATVDSCIWAAAGARWKKGSFPGCQPQLRKGRNARRVCAVWLIKPCACLPGLYHPVCNLWTSFQLALSAHNIFHPLETAFWEQFWRGDFAHTFMCFPFLIPLCSQKPKGLPAKKEIKTFRWLLRIRIKGGVKSCKWDLN